MINSRRRRLLADPNFLDVGLSETGLDQAIEAREKLKAMVQEGHLPAPERILVSPLQRTMQTAAAMFPQHPNVHVHEIIRERRTGLPCDERSPTNYPARRKTFRYMHMTGIDNLREDDNCAFDNVSTCASESSFDGENGLADFMMVGQISLSDIPTSPTSANDIEDAQMLRRRTRQLGTLLKSVREDVVCVVSHKGFLRELERDLLQRADATEFGNCEVRTYEIKLDCSGIESASLVFCFNSEEDVSPMTPICSPEPKNKFASATLVDEFVGMKSGG
jgi:broad specificity phosphatase PhoE